MAFNSSGLRDTARVLKIGINTILRTLKKLYPRQAASEEVVLDDVVLICDLDEQWVYVGNKNNRH